MNINSENDFGNSSIYYSDDEFLEDSIYSDEENYFHN
jgi:hypothetical protein